jgi:hypothetical protein
VFEKDKVDSQQNEIKNKRSQEREDPCHSFSSGRPLSPAVHCLLSEIGSVFLKSLNGIANNPVFLTMPKWKSLLLSH